MTDSKINYEKIIDELKVFEHNLDRNFILLHQNMSLDDLFLIFHKYRIIFKYYKNKNNELKEILHKAIEDSESLRRFLNSKPQVSEYELFKDLATFIYKSKNIKGDLRDRLVASINKFLHEEELDTDQHDFVDFSKIKK